MKLRYYAAIVTGALTMILTMSAAWCFTSWTLPGILIASAAAYFAGIIAVLATTQPKPKRRRTGEFKTYELKEVRF